MKNLESFITEAMNRESMFMGLTSKRTSEDFHFIPGEKVLLIKYDTHHREVQLRGIYEIDKVNRKSIVLKGDEFYRNLKFDEHGIYVQRNKNKYLGNSTCYWVLYNKALVHDKDLQELCANGHNTWGFMFHSNQRQEYIKELEDYLNELSC